MVELIAVIAIIALLGGLITTGVAYGMKGKLKDVTAKADAANAPVKTKEKTKMISQTYSVYYTSESPITKDGKNNAAVWKKADAVTDLFNLESLERSMADITVKMLFDDTNFYVNVKTVIPNNLHKFDEKGGIWGSSYFWFETRNAANEKVVVTVNEKGQFHYQINDMEVKKSEIKTIASDKKNKSVHESDVTIIYPWKHLTKDIKALSSLDIKFYEFRDIGDILRREIASDIQNCVDNDKIVYNTAKLIRKENTKEGKIISARNTHFAASKNVTLTLAADKPGAVHKNIFGMNNSPRISNAGRMLKEKELLKKLAPARVRHMDATHNNAGYALIDVSQIFPLFHADPDDPRNYIFEPTDFYLQQVADCGIEIEFHFGESIEHSGKRFRVHPPTDTKKWAKICVNILRHYNEGWANGKKWNIRYASLWEEPDNKKLFDGPYEKYLELYRDFATEMKKAFPNVKVGGPQSIQLKSVEALAALCKKESIPLDFLSVTGYVRDPINFYNTMKSVRAIANKYGFDKAEVVLAEWNLNPLDWKNLAADDHMKKSMANAAFSLATLVSLQEVADMTFFYHFASAGRWGSFASWNNPYKLYYALLFYSEFARKNLNKVPITTSYAGAGIYPLAGISKDGKVHLVVSQFRSATNQITVNLPADYQKCTVKILSDAYPKGEGVKNIKSSGNGKFRIPLDAKMFGAYLLEFEK